MKKFIFKGVVKDNLDPKGLGRIRLEPEDWIISDTKYVTEYLGKFTESKDKWNGVSDPFMFTPFLPNHINIIPQVGESVNIFYTDPESPFIDGFYMPMSIPDRGYSDTSSAEHMLSQSKQGLNYKKAKDLIKETGEYVKKKFEGSIVKHEDFGISSRLNSDIIFRDNDIIIRAGKINEEVSRKQGEPIRDENPAIIQVSKFDKTSEVVKGDVKYVTEKRMDHVEVLVEYFIENMNPVDGEFTGVVYIYKLKKNEGITESIYFNQITNVSEEDRELLYTRIVTSDSRNGVSRKIRESIKLIMSKGLGGVGELDFYIKHPSNVNHINNISMFPLYVRPVPSQYNQYKTDHDYKNDVLNWIRIRSRKGYGLIFSDEFDDIPTKNVEVQEYKVNTTDKPNKNIIVLSDTNYFLAYNNNIPTESKGVDFSKISNYNLTQEQILDQVIPNSYAMVRGEKLQELLDVIYMFLISHVHNPAEPAVVKPSIKKDLEQKFQDFKQNILSQKIRIN